MKTEAWVGVDMAQFLSEYSCPFVLQRGRPSVWLEMTFFSFIWSCNKIDVTYTPSHTHTHIHLA